VSALNIFAALASPRLHDSRSLIKTAAAAAAAAVLLVAVTARPAFAAAALFKATGGQVPRKETKTYIGAGLAVLGVNLVRPATVADRLQLRTGICIHAHLLLPSAAAVAAAAAAVRLCLQCIASALSNC